MPKQCLVRSCPNKSGSSEHTLFKIPDDINRRTAWFEAVASQLPKGSTIEDLNKKFVCDAHFAPFMYHISGNRRKRLFCNAIPQINEPETPDTNNLLPDPQDTNTLLPAPQNTNNLLPAPRNPNIPLLGANQRSKACQVYSEREIVQLKKKILSLENKIRKLKLDPPSSLIYKNRHKLAQYVSNEAWVLFDCAIQNQQRVTHGFRHSYEVKRLSASIANTCRNNRVVYKTLKSIFSLPSYRTLGRFEAEIGMKLINGADALTIPTSNSSIHSMRIECANTSNMSTEDMNIESISDDSNYMQNALVEVIPSPIIFD